VVQTRYPVAAEFDEIQAVEDVGTIGLDVGDFRLPSDRSLVVIDDQSRFFSIFVSKGLNESG
jgi:hypothetical protein